MAKRTNTKAVEDTKQADVQAVATKLAGIAESLAMAFSTQDKAKRDFEAQNVAATASRREQVLELCGIVCAWSERNAAGLNGSQEAWIKAFQSTAWKVSGRKGDVNVSTRDANGWPGLGMITSQIKRILLAYNIALGKVLTDKHINPETGKDDTPFDGVAYLTASPRWDITYQRSVLICKAADAAGFTGKDATPGKERRQRSVSDASRAKTHARVEETMLSASDGAYLASQAARCYAGQAGANVDAINKALQDFIGACSIAITPAARKAAVQADDGDNVVDMPQRKAA